MNGRGPAAVNRSVVDGAAVDGFEAEGDDQGWVEAVDPDGSGRGLVGKLTAHRSPGILHRAFSVLLFDDRDRLVLQCRSHVKYHSPLHWSNSCCGHPLPGEEVRLSAARRTSEELGCEPPDLTPAGMVTYRVEDGATGLLEHELNHLFIGRLPGPLHPDPAEVAGTREVSLPALRRIQAVDRFSAWFDVVLTAALQPALERFPGFAASEG